MNIIKFIKKKLFEPRETVVASNTLGPDEIKKIIGPKAEGMSNEEAQKYFLNMMEKLPVEEQMKIFFAKKDK